MYIVIYFVVGESSQKERQITCLREYDCAGVQVIDSLQSVRWSDGEPLEALLPSRVEDPGIVRTITQRVVPMDRDGGRLSVVWLIMEWCELGDLGVRTLLVLMGIKTRKMST